MATRPEISAPPGLRIEVFRDRGVEFAILELPAPPVAARGRLTRAEGEILELLLSGLSNGEIARRRGRSERTVAHQVEVVFRRLGVGSRLELFARFARARGDP